MGDTEEPIEKRLEQYRGIATKRWGSWGASYEEAVAAVGAQAAEALGRDEPLSEEELFTLPDAKGSLGSLLHPGHRVLDAIKAARKPEGAQ